MTDYEAKALELAREISKQVLGMECGCYADAWPASSCKTAVATTASAISGSVLAALQSAHAAGHAKGDRAGYERGIRDAIDEIRRRKQDCQESYVRIGSRHWQDRAEELSLTAAYVADFLPTQPKEPT